MHERIERALRALTGEQPRGKSGLKAG